MRVCGIDFSSHAVDLVTVPYEGAGAPVWTRFELYGQDAFERTRSVADVMPSRASALWDDVLAVGIEEPAGYNAGYGFRVQGSVLACIPARMLVHKMMPSEWRKAVGLPGNATKERVAVESCVLLANGVSYFNPNRDSDVADKFAWPQDAHDAHLIALAARALVGPGKAAAA